MLAIGAWVVGGWLWPGSAAAEPPKAATITPVRLGDAPHVGTIRVTVLDGIVEHETVPLEGAEVMVSANGGPAHVRFTGPDGIVRIPGLAAGAYELDVNAPGYRTSRVTGLPVRADEVAQLSITMVEGTLEAFDWSCGPPPVSGRLHRLARRVF